MITALRATLQPEAQEKDLLRFITCGSVDDGKSTLIGRLLYDSKSIMEDQLEALERSADITGGGQINLANLTDGLRAERERLAAALQARMTVEDFEEGTARDVELYDGSVITLRKLDTDYNPRDRQSAFRVLEEARENRELLTGLIFVDTESPSMFDQYHLPEKPLNRLTEKEIRPSPEALEKVNLSMFR